MAAPRLRGMRALVLHNPSAGGGSIAAEDLMAALRPSGLALSYVSTKGPEFPGILDRPTDFVIAAGGDGTVAKVLRRLPDRSVPVAIVPLGTANNIAQSLSIGGTPGEIAAGWATARTRRFDVGVAFGPWGRRRFVEAVGLGALATATASPAAGDKVDGAPKLRRGRKRLGVHLAEAEPLATAIEIDGKRLSEEALLVEVMNIPFSGPRLRLAPAADAGDGLFDVVVLRARDRRAMVTWLEAPEELGPPPVAVVQGRSVTLAWNEGPLRLDDGLFDPPEQPAEVTLELEREGVTMLVPAEGEVPERGALLQDGA